MTSYNDYISGDLLYWEGERGHASDERIITAAESGRTTHLFYREIHHTPFEYKGPLGLIKIERKQDRPSRFVFQLLHDQSPVDDLTVHATEIAITASPTEREAIIKARLGQGGFRQALLAQWGGCSVTGLFLPSILRASHIKPWRLSSNAERLDPYNELLLLPQYDALFDAGLITFELDGKIHAAKILNSTPENLLGISRNSRLRQISESHIPYLHFHQERVFNG